MGIGRVPRYFTYRSLDDLRADVDARDVAIPLTESPETLLAETVIAGRRVGNRLAVHPMEGCDGTLEGEPAELTFRRWERFGAGGAKLIWGEATAVTPEGRANPRQLLLTGDTAPLFAGLLASTRQAHRDRFGRDDDLLVGLQLTHSGRWSHGRPVIATHLPAVDALKGVAPTTPLLEDADLEDLAERYITAAKLAEEAGFDFVDVKQCHTYLLNELLSGTARPGQFGGDFEGRSRLALGIVAGIRAACPDILIASRVNVYDGPPFRGAAGETGAPVIDGCSSWGAAEDDPLTPDPAEPLRLIGLLREAGVSLVNVTLGSPYYNPHIGRPFERAPVDGYSPPEHPLVGVERHLRLTAAVQLAYPGLAVIGTGYSWLRHFAANAGAASVEAGWVSLMGLGRGALAYPDFAADLAELGHMVDRKACIGVSYCTALMRAKHNDLGQFPAGCAPRDPFYAEQYKLAAST
jgi:2,4-dienoyl-CoA reductase-like NADH-dependent reductase (Old Yellow Enzyme family)